MPYRRNQISAKGIFLQGDILMFTWSIVLTMVTSIVISVFSQDIYISRVLYEDTYNCKAHPPSALCSTYWTKLRLAGPLWPRDHGQCATGDDLPCFHLYFHLSTAATPRSSSPLSATRQQSSWLGWRCLVSGTFRDQVNSSFQG